MNNKNSSQALLHTPEGVRDIYGQEFQKKRSVISAIRQKMHLYGYEDIQTPSFEFFDVFSNEIGTTPSRELYKFFDKEGNTLALRPDFTPSAARCSAKYYMDTTKPIRFCYEGSSFVNTSNLQGKLKESTQMGMELINDGSANADGEAIALLVEALLRTGLTRFQISIGNADYFRGICDAAHIDHDTEMALREHISGKNYFAAEKLLMDSGVPEADRERLLSVTDFMGSVDALDEAASGADNERSMNAVYRLKEVYAVLQKYGVDKYISFDLSMLSKYNYYTGIIFKGFTYGVGDVIASGGRYDSLLSHFGKNAPAIGFMIPIDALMEALRRQNIDIQTDPAPIVITYNDHNYNEKLEYVQELRRNGSSAVLIPEDNG